MFAPSRFLMTASVLGRNKAEIYNSEKRKEAVLDPQVAVK